MLVYFLLSSITGFGFGQDPCSDGTYTMLPDLSKRSPSFVEDDVPLCDRYLPEGWYRAGVSHQIPTTAPDLFSCGTLYPYWMNMKGLLPASGSMATVEMCQVGFDSECVRSHTIQMKNCGHYFVYELTSLAVCNSAYCFERSGTCVDEAPTDVSVTYHNVSWKTYGKEALQIHRPTVNLICNFLPLSNKDLLYEVTWYVDNVEVLRNQTVSARQKETAILSASDIIKAKKKAGSMIHCVVGAKLKATEYPCTSNSSLPFFAGIKVWPTNLKINRGKTATLYLQLTIPFADQIIVHRGNDIDTPELSISMNRNESLDPCHDKKRDLHMKQCDIKILGFQFSERDKYATDEWKQVHNITIYNMDDGDYTGVKRLTLRLKTGGTMTSPSKIFEDIFLPDVQVQIIEKSSIWKGETCGSYTDPNMYTFDDRHFTCQLNGTFILYRNELYNQEVQEKHFPCYSGVTCNCAAAVRSGRDIFTVDVCSGEKAIINFPICDDKILKVRKQSDRHYKVLLPIGTIVDISIRTWRSVLILDITITASPSDVNNTRGLCGNLEEKYYDYFLGPDNSIIYEKDEHFCSYWMVNDTEDNLFTGSSKYKGLVSISKTLTKVCTCLNTTGGMKIYCNYGTTKDCKFTTGKQFFCILNQEGSRRRKRDLTYLYSQTINEEREHSDSGKLDSRRNKRQTVMSFTEAKNACLTEFEKSVPFRNCQKYVSNLGNSSLMSCISDLRFTGDVSFTAFHIEAVLEQCSTFIVLNSTFQRAEKEITRQIKSLCPSNCSGNGICIKGNCTCNSRYAGSDCSFDLLGPPRISLISNFGFCDKSEEDCDEITLYGRYFLENMNTRCYTARRRITENGSYVLIDYFQRNLEERTLFEGYCPLEYGKTPTWVTFFTFNVSNDGRNFTEDYNVYTYQSLCQEYHNDSGKISFTFKDGYCFIDGRCIADGKSNPNNECDVCDMANDKYSWTFNQGHCYINGRCFADGDVNLTNPCESCNASNSVMSWSISSDFCIINNACYFDGENRENSECEICNIDRNRYGWTFTEDGYCLIDGYCVREGEHHSKKECYVCNPALNKKAWSIDSDGYCFINGSCIRDGEHATQQECTVCNPASKINEWSFNSDFCFINNVCYFDGENRENSDCEICNIGKNRYGWTITEDGYCLINGHCVREGEHDSEKECHVCNPVLNKRDWSIDSDSYCFINGSCVRDGEHATLEKCKVCNPASNVKGWSFDSGTYCIINGRCVNQGERDTLNECNICNPALNDKDWSIESGCSPVTKQTKTEFTTTESMIVTTELLSFTTATEASASTKVSTNLTKSRETSKTPVSTAPSATTMTESTAIEATTTKSTLQPIITKTPTYMKKETTKTGIEPTKKPTASYTTAEKTISVTTKAKETDQAVKEATTKKIIKETMPTETSITFGGMTKPISVKHTTISMTTNPTSKDEIKQIVTDPVTTKTTTKRTRSDQTTEQTTIIKIMTNQVSVEPSTIRAPESTKTKKPSVFINEVRTTAFPKATTQISTEPTHLTKFTEVLTSISTCCATTTDYPKSPKSSAVHQYTVLAVSVAAPAFFVLVIIVIACFIHCYRKSHTAVVLQASKKANNMMDMKDPSRMRQTKTKSADEVFSDSEFGMNISGNKYSKFSEEDNPFST